MIITLKICDVQIGKHLRPCKLSVYSGVGRDIIDKCAIWYVISTGQLEIQYIQRHSHHQSLLNHSHLHTLKVTESLSLPLLLHNPLLPFTILFAVWDHLLSLCPLPYFSFFLQHTSFWVPIPITPLRLWV